MMELSNKTGKASTAVPDGEGVGAEPLRVLRSPRQPAAATGLRDMLALVRGNFFIILLVVIMSVGAGWAYLAYAPPRYLASATLLVQPPASPMPEEYIIASQTQAMRSDAVLRAVVQQLELVKAGIADDDKTFLMDRARVAKRYLAQYIPALAKVEKKGDAVQEAIQTLRRNMSISRPAMTPIMTISYDSTDPARAAAIVNTLVETFRKQHRDGEVAALQESVDWLTQRLAEVRLQHETAERAVETFRAANNIVGSGSNQSLQAEQRLFELSLQLEAAKAAAGNAFPSSGNLPEGKPAKVMPERVVKLRSGVEVEALQPAGVQRSLATSGSEIDRRQVALQQAFDAASAKVRDINRLGARLRELEASAQTYRTLYGSTLVRYEEAVQQAMAPEHDGIQILISAQQARYPSHPRRLLVFVFAFAFGVAFGIGVAVLRELLRLDTSERAA
jgi:succinoglycan biosynthesis transport protein ExoP